MPGFRGMLACVLVSLTTLGLAQSRDELAAQHVLGPKWKQLSRGAGTVFAGTVLAITTNPANESHPVPTIEITFRVSRGVVGVQAGEVFTIHEWAGASVLQRPMHRGQRMLLLLYPPSSIGLTSPIGGHLGQIELDPSGRFVISPATLEDRQSRTAREGQGSPIVQTRINVDQLERAIRSAREGSE